MVERERPEWVVAGSTAYVVHTATFGTPNVHRVTIDKVGKRDVVVGGRRFNGSKPQSVYNAPGVYELRELGDHYRGARLVGPDDPRLPEWEAETTHARTENAAHGAYEVWRRARTAENAAAVAEAFTALTTSTVARESR